MTRKSTHDPSKHASILDVMGDRHLLGEHFKNANDWASWRAYGHS